MSRNNGNTVNIAISGVGGQGVLTLAEILAKAAVLEGFDVRVGEIHGMAQRGGHVVCTVRIGPDAKGPIIDAGTADLLVGFEPIETLREIHLIKKNGCVLMSSHVQYPVAVSMGQTEYPSRESIRESINRFTNNLMEFDAMSIAIEAGNSYALNMVMFGATIGTGLVPISMKSALQEIRESFPGRFEKTNIQAAEAGFDRVKSCL
jgi:indolepyruvate ferredoxin oxidoreductase beta subunit